VTAVPESLWRGEGIPRYDRSMTIKIAVSLPDHLVTAARRAVKHGHAASVSAYVAEAMAAYQDEHRFDAMVDDILQRTGGPMTDAEKAWADDLLAGR